MPCIRLPGSGLRSTETGHLCERRHFSPKLFPGLRLTSTQSDDSTLLAALHAEGSAWLHAGLSPYCDCDEEEDDDRTVMAGGVVRAQTGAV